MVRAVGGGGDRPGNKFAPNPYIWPYETAAAPPGKLGYATREQAMKHVGHPPRIVGAVEFPPTPFRTHGGAKSKIPKKLGA